MSRFNKSNIDEAAARSRPALCPRCSAEMVKYLDARIAETIRVYQSEGSEHALASAEQIGFHLAEIRSVVEGRDTSGVYDQCGPKRKR